MTRDKGPAAELLDTLAAIDPFVFSSFYRRARLHREAPRPSRATVWLDVTTECPLTCSFCFASGTLGSGRRLTPATLERLEDSLCGVPNIVLIGGEPLTHPDLRALLAILRPRHERIEIYTNGLALPDEASHRSRWLAVRFGGPGARVTLTLAVDRFHREQYGEAAFRAKLDAFLGAREAGWPVDVRFNVTAEGLHTSGYLIPETIEALLADLHEGLVAAFRSAVAERDLDARFQLNPVVRLGRAAGATGEYLKAEDAIFSSEIVLTPEHDDAVNVYSYLPATWMPDPPAALRVATVDVGAFAALVRDRVVASHVGHAEAFDVLHRARLQGHWDPEAARSLRVEGLISRLGDWSAARELWMSGVANRLEGLCARDGLGWDLSTDRRIRRLSAPILRRFLARHLASRPADRFVDSLVSLAAGCVERGALPAFTGYSQRAGLLLDAPDAPIPLARAPLDLGPDAPHLGDALVRPRLSPHLRIDAEGEPQLRLDGLGEIPFGPVRSLDEAAISHRELMGSLAYFLPENLHACFVSHVRARLRHAARSTDAVDTRRSELANACAAIDTLPIPAEPTESRAEALRLIAGEEFALLKALPEVAAIL